MREQQSENANAQGRELLVHAGPERAIPVTESLPSSSQRATSPHPVLQMQRRYGNRYVQRMLGLSRQSDGSGAGEVTPDVESAIERARSGGQGLDSRTRGQMESAFGAEFSGVRIHTGAESHALNRSVNAVAFTTGRDIFFRYGAYNPDSSGGRELLAHELTHVVQQGAAQQVSGQAQRVAVQRMCSDCEKEKKNHVQAKLVVSEANDQYEQEADQVARTVVGTLNSGNAEFGRSATLLPGASAGAVQRESAPSKKEGESQRSLPPPTPDPVSTLLSDVAPSREQAISSAKPDEAPKPKNDQSLGRTSPVGANPTCDFQVQLTYRNFHAWKTIGRRFEVLHEPGVFSQWSFKCPKGIDPFAMGPLENWTMGGAISILNYHLFQIHSKDLLEVSIDAAGGLQKGDQGVAAMGQIGPTAQLHLSNLLPSLFGPGTETLLTANLSGQLIQPLGQQPRIWSTAFSFGVKVQF